MSSITAATDEEGNEVDVSSDITFYVDGSAHYVVPTQVTDLNNEVTDEFDGSYTFVYYQLNGDGEWEQVTTLTPGDTLTNEITEAGTYAVAVEYSNEETEKLTFELVKCLLTLPTPLSTMSGWTTHGSRLQHLHRVIR